MLLTVPQNIVYEWATGHGQVQSAELTWDIETPRFDPGTNKFSSLRVDLIFKAEWPTRWARIQGHSRPEPDGPQSSLLKTFRTCEISTPDGITSIDHQTGTKLIKHFNRAAPLSSSRWVFTDAAPILVGRWVLDNFEQLGNRIHSESDERIRISLIDPVRCEIFIKNTARGERPALDSLIFLDDHNVPTSVHRYSEFQHVEGIAVPVPRRRDVSLMNMPPEVIKQFNDKIPLDRVDYLTAITLQTYIDDSFIYSVTEGGRDVSDMAAKELDQEKLRMTNSLARVNPGRSYKWWLVLMAASLGVLLVVFQIRRLNK